MKFINSFPIRYLFFNLCLMVASLGLVPAQEVTLHASLDTTKALMGDQLRLSLRVEKSAAARVFLPVFGDTLAGGIEILQKLPVDTVNTKDGKTALQQDLLITVFDTGDFEIPPIPVLLQTGNTMDTLHTLPVFFTVISMKGDTTLRDIKGNMTTPVSLVEVFPWALGLVVLLALLYLIWLWIRKHKKTGDANIPDRPADPPDVTALRQLEQMRVEKTWLHKPVKTYYISLTEVLRVYIHERFGVLALEQTTDEILASLKETGCEGGALSRLKAILKLSDLVKFAKVIPEEAENAQQVIGAVEFVKATAMKGRPFVEVIPDNQQEMSKEGAE